MAKNKMVMTTYDGEKCISAKPLLDLFERAASKEDEYLVARYGGMRLLGFDPSGQLEQAQKELGKGKMATLSFTVYLYILPSKGGDPIFEGWSEREAKQLSNVRLANEMKEEEL